MIFLKALSSHSGQFSASNMCHTFYIEATATHDKKGHGKKRTNILMCVYTVHMPGRDEASQLSDRRCTGAVLEPYPTKLGIDLIKTKLHHLAYLTIAF